MKQPLGITYSIPDGQEATGVYEDPDGIEVFETSIPYTLSDGVSLQPPLPVFDAGGPVFQDALGNAQIAQAVKGLSATWRTGAFVAGNNVFGWGYASPPIVSSQLGTMVDEPYSGGRLISFWEAPDDSRIIVCFSGDVVDQLDGYTFQINGTVLNVTEGATYSAANNWTIMYLEPHWMIDGEAYVITRVPIPTPDSNWILTDGDWDDSGVWLDNQDWND